MKTNRFRVLSAIFAVAICSDVAIASAEQSPAGARPNIVLIVSDDQAWTDYGFMGHAHIETPNLDRLAADGVTFRRGYVPTALCRPSLMTLVTGHYAHRHAVTGNSPSRNRAEFGGKLYTERRAALISYIKRFDNLPALLAERGYFSHQSGKWWEGSYKQGDFTHGMTRGFPNPGCRGGDDGWKIGREGMEPVEKFVDMAIDKQKPFFLWYAPMMPHVPHTPPKRLLEKYSRVAGLTRQTAGYYAMCEWFDETCGRLIAYLEKKGVRDNTLIMYVTDNGWIQHPNAGHHMTRSKASPYEGGIRTPIMFSWPDKLKPADRDEVVSSIDIMPTILAAAGANVPPGLPGLNLLENLEAGTPVQREMIFGENFAHNIADIEDPEASLTFRWVIAGKWKLLLTYDGEVVRTSKEWDSRTGTEPQLFDLLADPHEKHNLAASHPDVVTRLAREIANWYPVTKRKTEETVIRSANDDSATPSSESGVAGDDCDLPIGSELVANGEFEKSEKGTFDGWTSSPQPGVASASAAPTVIGGNGSAKLAAGGGFLLQTVSTLGIRDFALELDFAVLDTASTGVRSFGVVTYSTEGVAHSITLTGGQKSGTYTRRQCYVGTNAAVKEIGLFSATSSADYLVDNVSSRSRRFIPCNHVRAAILYRIDADGGNMLCLSANSVRDDRPAGIPWFGGGRTGFRDPYPLSEDCFLAAEDKSLLVLDGNGSVQEFYRADRMVHDPRVIRSRPRERVVPPLSDLSKSTGRLILANIYHGRNMQGVRRGQIKKLLVLEDLPKPISYYSLPGIISMDGTHTLRRVLGTVPVEPDGSASFEVPPLRALYFVALDEKDLAVKRMQSYTMVMPGETQGCVGCHEPRTQPPGSAGGGTLMALERPPSRIEPTHGVPDVKHEPPPTGDSP